MPTSTLANVALNLKISILKVKFNLSRAKFKALSSKFNFTTVLNCNHAPQQQKTICDINFLSNKNYKFDPYIFVAG